MAKAKYINVTNVTVNPIDEDGFVSIDIKQGDTTTRIKAYVDSVETSAN